MADSYTSELRDIIDRAFTAEFEGRATVQMVHGSVYRDLPDHLIDYLIGKGIKAEIGAYFRDKDADGLPKRPKVNDDGEHAQLSLLSADEMAYLYGRYLDASEANKAQAEKLRRVCLSKHGVDLAAEAVAS